MEKRRIFNKQTFFSHQNYCLFLENLNKNNIKKDKNNLGVDANLKLC